MVILIWFYEPSAHFQWALHLNFIFNRWLNEVILCMERLFDIVDFIYAQPDYLPLEPLEFSVHKHDTYASRYSSKIDLELGKELKLFKIIQRKNHQIRKFKKIGDLRQL